MEISNDFDKLDNILGICYESPLAENIFMMLDDYISAVSTIIGDKGGWLAWYIFDNLCGKNELEAGREGNVKVIKNIDDLLWLIDLTKYDTKDSMKDSVIKISVTGYGKTHTTEIADDSDVYDITRSFMFLGGALTYGRKSLARAFADTGQEILDEKN